MNKLKIKYKLILERTNLWASTHFLQLALFNVILIFLFLLRSVGYFDPFLPLSVNTIVLISFVLAIILFGANSSALFIVSVVFWVFAAFLRIVRVDIWAERTSIYVFESLVIGMILLLFESLCRHKKH